MNKKKVSISEKISTHVVQELPRCIQCNRCMEACPVTKPIFSILELNEATKPDTPVTEKIKKFAFSCVQCGRCNPVCPEGLHREEMMLFLRYKLRTVKPYEYKRYLAIRGPDLSPIAQTAQGLFTAMKMKKAPDLAHHMEIVPSTQTPVLFYPGCYIYSFETIRRTKRLLNHVGTSYTILGGLTTCCGIPQLLQGEFDLADRYMEILHEKILKLKPSVIITGCAECYEALVRIKETYHELFEVLSVVEYLMRNRHKFPQVKLREKTTFHDSCRMTRRYNKGEIARHAITIFAPLIEMKHTRESAFCCYHWNHGYDSKNPTNRQNLLTEAAQLAPTMVCECITCYEEFKKLKSDVEVIDILQLFEEAIDIQSEIHGK